MFAHLLGRWIMVGRGLVLREENSRSWEAIRKGKVLMTLEMIRCDKGVSSLDKEIDIKEDKKKIESWCISSCDWKDDTKKVRQSS